MESKIVRNIIALILLVALTGCAVLSETERSAYNESLEKAKTIIKSNKGVEVYKKYYWYTQHKAMAQSKVSSAGGYAKNMTSRDFAIEIALEQCHKRLLMRYDEITDKVSCEIINVDNEWVNK